jgi:acetyltransferase-like isoleucine patch superfamily enzyme
MSSAIQGIKNRVFQLLAHFAPGARSLRVWLHKGRGVRIGRNVWIGYDVVLETSRPELITIGHNTIISVRAILIAHFRHQQGIQIEEDVFIGPGAIILPGVTIGRGAVVTAGSVVAESVAPSVMVQGNPARPIAKCGLTLVSDDVSLKQFYRSLRPVKSPQTLKPSN